MQNMMVSQDFVRPNFSAYTYRPREGGQQPWRADSAFFVCVCWTVVEASTAQAEECKAVQQ